MSKVYVSSTFLDLQEHRRALEQALRRLGHVDVAMEHYTAENRSSLERCLADVAECDLYIGVFAWRYGWIPEEDNPSRFSITEFEYREAIRHNKPCLVFLLDGKAAWPPDFIDDDRTRIRKLRDELAGHHLPALFSSPQDLMAAVTQAVAKWEKDDVPSFEFSHYLDVLRRRFRRIDLDALTPPQREEYLQLELQSVFVEQKVRRGGSSPDGAASATEEAGSDARRTVTVQDIVDDEPQPVLEFITDPRSRLAVILGNPGSGKSTLARFLLLSLADPITKNPSEVFRQHFDAFIPFLIELRAYVALSTSRKCETFLEYLEYLRKTEAWRIEGRAIDEYLNKSGKAFFIFDGVDEIFDPEERDRILQQIIAFAETYPTIKVIVTSRVVGYRRRTLSDAGFQHAILQDLDESQVETFIARWYRLAMGDRPDEARDRLERLMRTYRESASMRQLAGNPLLLTIMAIIGKHQELPRERWRLYDHAASVLIQHWDVNKHLSNARVEASLIEEEDRKQLLRVLAFRMQGAGGGPAGNYVERDTLQTVFAAYVQERYQAEPTQATRIARAMIDQFRERNFILSLYGAGLYGFVHRAFLEYFCASAYVFRFEKTHEIDVEDLKALFRNRRSDPSWHEVLRLICGMIGEKFAGEIVEDLLDADPNPENATEPWNVALAISCLGEVRNIAGIANAARRTLCEVLRVFDSIHIDRRFLRDELVKRVVAIGQDWPPNPAIAEWVLARRRPTQSWVDDQLFAQLIAATAKSSEECRRALLDCLKLRPSGYRREAVYALSAGWVSDPRSAPILRELMTFDADYETRTAAILGLGQYFGEQPGILFSIENALRSDRHWIVRMAALYELAAHSSDAPHTLDLLENHALHDVSEYVQSAAKDALAEYFPREAVTLTLLLDRHTRASIERLLNGPVPDLPHLIELAAVHQDEAFRETALRVIAKHFSKLPEVFPLLRDRAAYDSRAIVRMCAISALMEYYPEAPQTTSLLRRSLVSDTHPWVRETALHSIVERSPTDSRTLDLIRERAVEDPHEFVRESAIDAISQYFLHDWRSVPLLRDRLQRDPDPYVRRNAAYALGACQDPRANAVLTTAAYFDYDDRVRAASAEALDRRWRAKFASHSYDRVAGQLEHLSNESLDYYWQDGQDLRALLENDARTHPRSSVRSAALTILQSEYGPQPDLLAERVVTDPDPFVRLTALRLIAQQDQIVAELDPTGLRIRRRYLLGQGCSILRNRALNDEDGEVRAEAIALLAGLESHERPPTEFFEQFVRSDPSGSVRRAGIYALAPNLSEKETLDMLCKSAADDPDPRVRLPALLSIANAATAEVEDCLAACSASETDNVVRRFAMEAADVRAAKKLSADSRHAPELLLDYIVNGDRAPVRVAAADWFHKYDDLYSRHDELWPALLHGCLHDECPANRSEFLTRAVHWFRGRAAADALRARCAATDPDPGVRDWAEHIWDYD